MCGISGLFNYKFNKIKNLHKIIKNFNLKLKHRGPDDNGYWMNEYIGFGHTRLSIIDIDKRSKQPMKANNLIITFNGEIYNYKKLKKNIKDKWDFKTESDTEVILAYYNEFYTDCIKYFNGMFSFTIWDINRKELFCVRDRFGIKPFYYMVQNDIFYFGSEAKILFPHLEKKEIDIDSISEYLIFQYMLGENTMIKNVKQLLPGQALLIKNSEIKKWVYYDINYKNKYNYSEEKYIEDLQDIINDSIDLHIISDVPISSYNSGGIDSSLISILTNNRGKLDKMYHGTFTEYEGYNESKYAKTIENRTKTKLDIMDINSEDFMKNIKDIIYYLDFPVAGPGSFPQYMISKYVSEKYKVVLGGQGADEIFMGYTRYLLPYFEKCINDSINGESKKLRNLLNEMKTLKNYKNMIKTFWKENVFESLDKRYFQLVNRTSDLKNIINWNVIDKNKIFKKFQKKFNIDVFDNDDYFNKMLNFDIKYSLPALLHVEDRVSMAWSIESRVPFINHKIIDYASKIPEDKKVKFGKMKYLLKKAFKKELPRKIVNRKDKMGFPVPLNEWFNNGLKDYIMDLIIKLKNRNLKFLNLNNKIINELKNTTKFSRKIWVLINLELWYENIFN